MLNFPVKFSDEIKTRYKSAGRPEVEAEHMRLVLHDGENDGGNPMMSADFGGSVNVETLAANKDIALKDPIHQLLDPDGADRDVNFPDPVLSYWMVVKNTGGAFDLVCKDGASNIATITPGNKETFYSDQTNWYIL
jgi:hypothetical protein